VAMPGMAMVVPVIVTMVVRMIVRMIVMMMVVVMSHGALRRINSGWFLCRDYSAGE
jgi:hypothetical protein